MRLLECGSGKFRPPKDVHGADIPKYAILSHTWGADTEEVTFQDLVDGTGKKKIGYEKLRFCEEQAKRDGLRYFWVDSCCIDKSNSAELSEALNSMFRWYQNADRCYVYLSDVSIPDGHNTQLQSKLASRAKRLLILGQELLLPLRPAEGITNKGQQSGNTGAVDQGAFEIARTWESMFRTSRWFTRGWTLQELVAPRSVEFYSKEGQRLGDKTSLEQHIHEITGIDVRALQGVSLNEYSVTERFKWAESRQTAREEDGAYCLLGIFGISMSPIYGEGKENARRRLKHEIETSAPKYKKAPNCVWMVPFERNPCFTGRQSELNTLRQALFTGDYTTKVALTGLGGMGKTQIAIALAHQTRDEKENCSIIWMPATSKESIGQAYRNTAQKLGIPGWDDDEADVKKLVQDYLSSESAGQWLLIVDNADDISMWTDETDGESSRLIDYLPKSRFGSILFTTRSKKAATTFARQNVIELSVMNDIGSKELLRNYLQNKDLLVEQDDVTALLTQLTCLPLAIVQAATYINQNSMSLADYLLLLNSQEGEVIELLSEDFEDDGRYREVKNPVATTWLISFVQIRQRDIVAAEFLSFMACIDSKDIPPSIFPPNATAKEIADAMGTLKGYAFITQSSSDSPISIHRLVHLATRNWLRKENQLHAKMSQVAARLQTVLSHIDRRKRDTWRIYMPHAHYMIESVTQTENEANMLELLYLYGLCLTYEGRHNEAEHIHKRGFEITHTKLRVDHPMVVTSMVNLAATYVYQHRWDEAEKLGVQAMESSQRILGPDHHDTITSMNNLASTYIRQGRWDEAEKLGVQVMESSQRILGPDHHDTLMVMNNLASTYISQGRWDEAEKLEVQVIESCQRILGPDHPNTLKILSNFSSIYKHQGRWDEAEKLEVQVMESRQRILRPDHPDTLIAMNNLALTYTDQGRLDETEKLEVQVMESCQRILGPDHPDTLKAMHNLASTYTDQGRWDEAEKLEVQVMESRQRILGPDHPDTLMAMNNLASTYTDQGRLDETEKLEVQVMESCQRILGPDHPDTLKAMHNLAVAYSNQGRWEPAIELIGDCILKRVLLMGVEHPDTVASITLFNQMGL